MDYWNTIQELKKWTGIDNNEPDLILHNDLLKYKAYTEE